VGAGRRHDDFQLGEPGGQRPLGAAQVRDQRRVADVRVARDLRPHLVGVGHLRDRLGVHERHRLDAPHAGAAQRVDELDLRDRGDGVLVLQPVARADLAHAHAGGERHVTHLANPGAVSR
jgi:hypothetical protein